MTNTPFMLPVPFWLLLILAVIVIFPGCATKGAEDPNVCYMQFLGRTESGVTVVRQLCITEEQFAESQK